jgi:hypothetical protein
MEMTKTIAGVLGLLMTCSLTMADANAQTTTSYPVTATCSGGGQLCNNVANIPISTTGILQANFTGGPLVCSSIRIHYLVDGTEVTVTGFVGANQSTGVANLGPVSAGTHVLGLQAEGIVGGCNSGTLGSWAGTAQVTVAAQTAQVPTLSEWGFALLALFLGFGGVVALRRHNPRRI